MSKSWRSASELRLDSWYLILLDMTPYLLTGIEIQSELGVCPYRQGNHSLQFSVVALSLCRQSYRNVSVGNVLGVL